MIGNANRLLEAAADVLGGKTAVKSQSDVTADVTPLASGTVVTVAVLGVVAVWIASSRRPRRRRSRKSRRR